VGNLGEEGKEIPECKEKQSSGGEEKETEKKTGERNPGVRRERERQS
jgi:hypothetical protein